MSCLFARLWPKVTAFTGEGQWRKNKLYVWIFSTKLGLRWPSFIHQVSIMPSGFQYLGWAAILLWKKIISTKIATMVFFALTRARAYSSSTVSVLWSAYFYFQLIVVPRVLWILAIYANNKSNVTVTTQAKPAFTANVIRNSNHAGIIVMSVCNLAAMQNPFHSSLNGLFVSSGWHWCVCQ